MTDTQTRVERDVCRYGEQVHVTVRLGRYGDSRRAADVVADWSDRKGDGKPRATVELFASDGTRLAKGWVKWCRDLHTALFAAGASTFTIREPTTDDVHELPPPDPADRKPRYVRVKVDGDRPDRYEFVGMLHGVVSQAGPGPDTVHIEHGTRTDRFAGVDADQNVMARLRSRAGDDAVTEGFPAPAGGPEPLTPPPPDLDKIEAARAALLDLRDVQRRLDKQRETMRDNERHVLDKSRTARALMDAAGMQSCTVDGRVYWAGPEYVYTETPW